MYVRRIIFHTDGGPLGPWKEFATVEPRSGLCTDPASPTSNLALRFGAALALSFTGQVLLVGAPDYSIDGSNACPGNKLVGMVLTYEPSGVSYSLCVTVPATPPLPNAAMHLLRDAHNRC